MRRAVVVALVLLAPSTGGSSPAHTCRAIPVSQRPVRYAHASTLQQAVAAATPCDWIIVAPGTYRGPLTIRTPDVHLRGLDRNTVVLDGGHRVGNGIVVDANGVSVENMTVRDFDRRSRNDDDTGTQIAWRGVDGWSGRYLTVYDDGLLGGYGVWAARSTRGRLDRVFASGFDDSGLYVGACRNCRTVVSDSVAERNLIGLAATNAGGRFVVRDSLFEDNAVGASFNSSLSDPPPPQRGTCTAAPTITTTRLARCTVFRDNRVLDNDAVHVPAETSSLRPGVGIGIDLLGSIGDLVTANVFADNRNIGVLGLQLPVSGHTRFPLAGDRISGNTISGSRLALALAGGAGSVDDCVEIAVGATEPADLAPYSCRQATTPALPAGATARVVVLVRRLHAQAVAALGVPQPRPRPLPTMPRPCLGVPPTPVCAG